MDISVIFWKLRHKIKRLAAYLFQLNCLTILDIEVACTNYEGVDAVKRALKKGLELSTENMPIKVCIYRHMLTTIYSIGENIMGPRPQALVWQQTGGEFKI